MDSTLVLDSHIGSGEAIIQEQEVYITAVKRRTRSSKTKVSYQNAEIIGNGSFGVVLKARLLETDELVAIKKVVQDKRFKNRELDLMTTMRHENIILLKYFHYKDASVEGGDDVLSLIMEYMPMSLYQRLSYFVNNKSLPPRFEIKIYMFQLLKGLNYLHNYKKICHRDIKPQNLLVDPDTFQLKICDFGSAKILNHNNKESNVAYICSRYYRAPELIFGSTQYSTKIDIWSAGCVMAELLLGQPIFAGRSSIDQMVETIKILGTPSLDEVMALNSTYGYHYKLPHIKPIPLHNVFKKESCYTIDFLQNLLQYDSRKRLDPLFALCHDYFSTLNFKHSTREPMNGPQNHLFHFDVGVEFAHLSSQELAYITSKLSI